MGVTFWPWPAMKMMDYYEKAHECTQCQFFDRTYDSHVFPTLRTSAESLSEQDTVNLCINFHWNTADKKAVIDRYHDFKGIPTCENGVTGIEIPIWE